jgi:hypothetical protein
LRDALQSLTFFISFDNLAFVTPPVGRFEEGQADEKGLPVRIFADDVPAPGKSNDVAVGRA